MTTIVAKELPHKVGTAEIANAELKNIAMQFMENFTALGGQVADLQQAAIELQKAAATGSSSSGGGGGSGGGSVPSEITAAVTAAQTAAGAAIANAATATAAKDAAAASATAAAASAASIRWSTAFVVSIEKALTYSGTGELDEFPMVAFVPDTSADAVYIVTAYFRFRVAVSAGSSNKRYCKLSTDTADSSKTATWSNVPDGSSSGTAIAKGQVESVTIEATGADTLHILNGGTSDTAASGYSTNPCDVFLKITKKVYQPVESGDETGGESSGGGAAITP